MRISILSFIASILFISANPATLKTDPVTFYLTENGIKGVATIHETSLQDLRKAFPKGKYYKDDAPLEYESSEYQVESYNTTFYIKNDTLKGISIMSPCKAIVLNDVILGSTTLAQFKTLHPELTTYKKNNILSQELVMCQIGNINLQFIDPVTKKYSEKGMIFYTVGIGPIKR